MIPNEKKAQVDSTLVGEDVEMQLDASATQHLMGLLSGIYSNTVRAVLREYATNARDSHVEAGVELPIEVELPTDLRPTLTIRDFGVGLDAEDIRAIYSRYGASTKRATNDANGMLGIGCKAALAYTDQFSLVARKGGVQTTVSVSRDAKGAGSMKILDERASYAPNGVEIVIPTERDDDFEGEAAELFGYWPDGTVLVNGTEVAPIVGDVTITGTPGEDGAIVALPKAERGYSYNPGTGKRERQGVEDDVLVMGNVPYPVDFKADAKLIAWVPIGTVDFAPPRESLQDTPRTRWACGEILQTFVREAVKSVQRDVDAATTPAEALAAYNDSKFLCAKGATYSYRGTPLPVDFGGPWTVVGKNGTYYGGRGASSSYPSITLDVALAAPAWITGYTNAKFSADQRLKLDMYLKDQLGDQVSGDKAILTAAPALSCAEWFADEITFDWSDIRKFKLPTTTTTAAPAWNNRAVKGTYVTFVPGDRYPTDKYAAADLPKTELVYVEAGKYEGGTYWRKLSAVNDKATLCVIPTNRVTKFKRDFPHAISYEDAMASAAKAWWDGLTDGKRKLLAWSPSNEAAEIASMPLDWAEVADERLTAITKRLEARERLNGDTERYTALVRWIEPTPATEQDDGATLSREYPLLDAVGYSVRNDHRDHLTLYVNAAHAARTEED